MKLLFWLLYFALMWWFWWPSAAGDPARPPAAAGLSGVEQDYYRQVFDYAMTAVKPGESYAWESYSGRGVISVSTPFTSKSQATCRRFTETFSIGGAIGTDSGVACRREGREGWCRLKETDALTCAMEPPGSLLEQGVQGAGDVLESAKDALGRLR